MNNLSTNQKIALGVGTAATVGAVIATYLALRSGKKASSDVDQEEEEEVKTAKPTKKAAESVDEKLDKANDLRSAGNKAFTNKDYDEAIRLYTEALSLSETSAHLLYSNRSAAFLFKGDNKKAVEDAKKCLEMKPDWSKAYFRMGKALMASGEIDNAFKHFYKGLLLDNTSDELKILLEQSSRALGPGERDSRTHVEKELVKLYSKEQCEELCNNSLHIPYQTVRKIVEEAKANKFSTLLEDEILEKSAEEHPVETYRILTEILIELDEIEEALSFATKAHEAKPTDPAILLLLVTTLLRNGGLDNFNNAFEYMREAIRLAPRNVQVVHTYASILLQLVTVGAQAPAPVRDLLNELKNGLDTVDANHLLIADSGMRLWFKLLEEHTNELIAEEQKNMQLKTPQDEAYLYGLTKGAFSKVCLEPFFQQALSQVVFSNPGLETVLAPFRSAFTSLKPGTTYDSLATFIFALALQCYRNNYSWPVSPEDNSRLQNFIEAANTKLNNQADSLVQDGVLDSEFSFYLSLISLFQPLHTIQGLAPVIERVDLTKLHVWFASVLKKTVLDHEEEQKIKESIVSLTPIPIDPLVSFYNENVPVWDSAGLAAGRLTTVSFKQELSWIFKDYVPKDLNGPVKTLIAGCGSGAEVYQLATFYKDLEISAIDFSVDSLAFAIRQHKDLGINNINFYLADVQQISPAEFPDLFDLIIANGLVHHLSNPLQGWEKLASVLKSGGLLKMSLYSGRFIEALQKARKYLQKSGEFTPALFSDVTPLAQLRRKPTIDEIRKARAIILGCDEKDLEDLKEFVTSPQFYALYEFTDLIFHPRVQGFTFQVIGECLKKVGLKLVGFEFPGLAQEHYLRYIVEYPNDTKMINCKYLDTFSAKFPDAFKNFTHTINFIAEKP